MFGVLVDAGDTALGSWTPLDRDGLHSLAWRVEMFGEPVRGEFEAMNGARFRARSSRAARLEVEIADEARVKGRAPLACKTDRIDAWVGGVEHGWSDVDHVAELRTKLPARRRKPFGQCTIVPLRVPPQCDATCLVHWYGVSIACAHPTA